jgi:PKD repeat protein
MIAVMSLRSGLILGVVSLLALLVVASAGASPGWLSPVTVSVSEEGHQVSEPRVAFDKRGDAVAVWSSEDGALSDGTKKYEIQAAFRPAGGAWQGPETLSLPDGGDESAEDVSVGLDGHGDAVAVWQLYTGYTFVVEAAYRPAGGTWQAPVYLTPEEIPGTGRDPQVAVDEQGDAIAIWNRGGPFGGPVQESFRPAGGTWQAPVDVTDGQYGDRPQVAFDKQGEALALWSGVGRRNKEGQYEWELLSSLMPAGGEWQAPVEVSAPGLAGEPSVAVNGQGAVAAVWDQWTNGFLSSRTVQTAFMPAGGAWQAPVNIVGAADEIDQPKGAGNPGIAVDGQGDEVAVWTWEFSDTVQAAFMPAGGAWQAPVEISGEGAYAPQVAFDGQGDALAVWDGEDGTVQSAFKPVGGEWQAPVDIGNGGGPQVAIDGQGDAIAAWTGEDGIQATGYVAAGPVLNDVSIPSEGTVGQPLTFSVSPFDVWSVLGETSWSFGDGASAMGTSVTHTYTAAGTYEVMLHSADTLGNVTSTSDKVTIAPASATAPSGSEPTSGSPVSESPASEPPAIGTVSQSASVWHERGKSRAGTTFALSLNEQATVDFSFLRHVNGRMVGRRCLATTPRNAGYGACSRAVITGALSFPGRRGMNTVGFQGLVSHSKKLEPGRYTLVITATNVAGQHSSPKSLSFTIVE